jgi:hypothetical protein
MEIGAPVRDAEPLKSGLVSENFCKLPALKLRDRLCLGDTHLVTNSSLTSFVVSVEFLRALNDFLETWVRNTSYVFYYDSLVHACGNNNADAGLA